MLQALKPFLYFKQSHTGSISCWDVHENVEPAKFTPYLNDDGCKEQSVSRIPAVDPMIYEGKFPILRLDRVDRLLSSIPFFLFYW